MDRKKQRSMQDVAARKHPTTRKRSATRRYTASKKQQTFHPVRTFFKVMLSIVAAFVVLAGGVCFAYHQVTGDWPFGADEIAKDADETSILDALLGRNIKLNVAVFGVDKDGTRTDVAFVVHYDSAEESLSLLSIPRDTRVNVCTEVEELLGKSYGVMKFNAVHAIGGKEYGPQAAVLQLEDLLGIKIDHYVKVDFDALVEIVDAVGGVEVDVPQDMKWDMSDTGDIKIDLKKGLQTLDGNQALQLVRFRKGYANGDVGRIAVQQLFLKALAEKVLSTDSILKNLGDYIKVLYKYVDTDISLTDAMKYATYVKKIDMSKMTMETLPGVGQYIGGISYFIHDPQETTEVVDRIFYNVAASTDTNSSEDSKGLTIEVSNGGEVAGLAAKFTERLKNDGYTLTEPTNYAGEQMNYTRIQVKTEGAGQDLIAYFDDARVQLAPQEVGKVDIRIILGTNERG